jgi:hypothetical protein
MSSVYRLAPGFSFAPSGSITPAREPVPSATAAVSLVGNCGSENTQTAPRLLILLRSFVSALALGCTSGLSVIEPAALSPNRASKY